ncbi:hypothetical protein OKW34_008799 [Paraburkholderia youngii]|uniref:hypothetical protein n=1 Tax=Paraburkholderia youngii TaxID=2782701 RepID=UPI003D1DBA89
MLSHFTFRRRTQNPAPDAPPRIALIGYSKGAPDVLEALVAYPEVRNRLAAVVSAAGAVGGSPLADDAEQYQAELLRHVPGATCTSGERGAVQSLRPATRLGSRRTRFLHRHVSATRTHLVHSDVKL